MRVTTADLERIAQDWQDAYAKAHNKSPPLVIWERGWFRIDHGGWAPRYRRAKLEQMTATLRNFTQPEHRS